MSQKVKQIIIALVIIVIAFFAIQSFTREPSVDSTVITQSAQAQFADGREIVRLLNRLEAVTLNEAIFLNPIFLSLVNFEQPIPNEPIGRANPFAPLGSANLTTSTATSTR